MAELKWSPQEAYIDFFAASVSEIIKNRSVFNLSYEYFVAYGGRGGAKTWSFADACVIEGTLRPIRVLVTRELQNSIKDSIKSEIELTINERGLDGFYTIQEQDITGLNGTQFIFKGLKNNINSMKSISNVDVVLAEEAENITKVSWDKFLPSIRPRSGEPPIIIILFNPADELDDTWQRFIVTPPKKTISRKVNWSDNKYFPPHLEEQRLHCKNTRPKKDYDNIWEGVPLGSGDDVIIDRSWIRAARFASSKQGFSKVGSKVVSYDPAGQGRDSHAVLFADGNIVKYIDEWPKSPDLRKATRRAMEAVEKFDADEFRYDECGGFGDGVAVFVNDIVEGKDDEMSAVSADVAPINYGDSVVDPEDLIPGTEKTNDEMYANLKAQAHGVSAQKLYNTYRFVVLNEDVAPADMISIDIGDDEVFNKLTKELSSPIWVKSSRNSKKQVESKENMEKRTGQPSPNLADAFHMAFAPVEKQLSFFDMKWR